MRDINFFSIFKKERGKSSGLKIIIAVIAAVILVLNAGLIALYTLTINGVNQEIDQIEAKMGSEDFNDQLTLSKRLQIEGSLTDDYLTVLEHSKIQIEQIASVNTAVLDRVRSLVPASTTFYLAAYSNNQVRLECSSSAVTDPMDIYHAFLIDPNFTSVTLSDILVDDNGNVAFSLFCQMLGGEIQ